MNADTHRTAPHVAPRENTSHRARVQREGLRRARAEAFREVARLIEDGCIPSGRAIALIRRVAERSYRIGVEAMADAIQPEYLDLSVRISDLETHLSGVPSPFQSQRR